MNKKYLRDILWIFNHPQPESIPSYYISGLMPAHYLSIKKVVFLDINNPVKIIEHYNPKCIIISKAFSIKVAKLAEIAKDKGIKVISIFDDWIFENKNRTKINLPLALSSDYIITKTANAADEVYKNTKLSSVIIPDPIRFKSHTIFKKISQPIEACWFGMHSNHNTIINELNNLDKINLKINLSIISNTHEKFYEFCNINIFKNIKVKFITWNEKSNNDIIKSDVVLLPYSNDKKRLVKSSNRIVEALNLGRFTILSNAIHFEEFKNYTYFGNLSDGLSWVLEEYESARKITNDGQKYVLENYSLNKICEKWINLFEKIDFI